MEAYRTIIMLSLAYIMFCSTDTNAQTREIGARFSGLNNFDFVYKTKKSENRYIRHRLILANYSLLQSSNQTPHTLQLGYALGIEKRNPINDKLDFIHGIEPSINIALNATESRSTTILTPSIGYILGFQYNINEAFYVSIETIPSLTASFPIDDNGNNAFAINMGFNSNTAAITIAYRFDYKKKTN